MQEFDFTLKFSLPDAEIASDEHVERLGEAGCTDALVGIGRAGYISLQFSREASSALNAVTSAIADVKRAIPAARLVAVLPDLVGLTEVADILGCSRQYMRRLMLDGGSDFPVPVYEGKAALWRLAKVLEWLRDNERYRVEEPLLEVANTTMQLNLIRESSAIDRAVQENTRDLIS